MQRRKKLYWEGGHWQNMEEYAANYPLPKRRKMPCSLIQNQKSLFLEAFCLTWALPLVFR
jgi:hypothetical protein